MVEDWIDALVARTRLVQFDGKKCKAFDMFKKSGVPESLSEFPSALSFVDDVDPTYSAGGPNVMLWKGRTEFHLVGNVMKSNYPGVQKVFGSILAAFAGDVTLGGKVGYVLLRKESGMQAVTLTYGTEAEHLAVMAYWVCKEMVSVTVQ